MTQGKQVVSRRMGIQKVRLVQVGMPVKHGPVKLHVHESWLLETSSGARVWTGEGKVREMKCHPWRRKRREGQSDPSMFFVLTHIFIFFSSPFTPTTPLSRTILPMHFFIAFYVCTLLLVGI